MSVSYVGYNIKMLVDKFMDQKLFVLCTLLFDRNVGLVMIFLCANFYQYFFTPIIINKNYLLLYTFSLRRALDMSIG